MCSGLAGIMKEGGAEVKNWIPYCFLQKAELFNLLFVSNLNLLLQVDYEMYAFNLGSKCQNSVKTGGKTHLSDSLLALS